MVDYIIKTESTYDSRITLNKYLIQLGILLAITGITYFIDTILPEISINYPEYAGIIIIALPFIEAFRNWLKHHKDTEEVRIDPSTGIKINND